MDYKTNRKYQDKGWESMKAILDIEMPEKKRRIFPIFWLLPIVAASFFLVFSTLNFYKQKTEAVETFSNEKIAATKTKNQENSTPKSTILPNKSSNVENYSSIQLNTKNNPKQDFITQPVSNSPVNDIKHNSKNSNKSIQNNAMSIIKADKTTKIGSDIIHPSLVINPIINISDHNEEKENNERYLNIEKLASKSFVHHNDLAENIIGSKVLIPLSTENILENEEYTEPLKLKKTNHLGFEVAFARNITNTMNEYSIGGRYTLLSYNNFNLLVRASGYLAPININYSNTYLADQTSGFINNVSINRTVNSMIGINSSIQLNYKINAIKGMYLFGGGGFLTNWSIDEAQDFQPNLQNSRNQLEDTKSKSNLGYRKFNTFGQAGIGYQFNHFGIELFYRHSQNTLRNSGIVDLNSSWINYVGLQGIYNL